MRPLKTLFKRQQLVLTSIPIALLVGLLLSMGRPKRIEFNHFHPNTGETKLHIELAQQ